MNETIKSRALTYDRQVPRYTSYPTAPHFKPGFVHESYTQWLTAIPEGAALSLYLHVPFCTKMCHYCGCHTKVTQRYAPVEDYIHLMMREIAIASEHFKPGQRVTQIHFGGGTPSLMLPQDFTRVMDTLRRYFAFAPDIEIAMEMDPRGITQAHVEAYAAGGLNRASIGVQDFDDTVLAAVNRPQPFALSEKLVKWLREAGINHINFDLLYGLPHQTLETMTATIEKALTLAPNRIALFGYAHVPWMKKHMRLIDESALPDKSLRYDLFERGAQQLQAAGYVLVGIDHFARADDTLALARSNGTLHRNFQGYTTDASAYLIGFGASSIGKFAQGYVQNAVAMPAYRDHILAGRLSAEKSCTITDDDRLRADIIERLMCDLRVDVAAICARHHVPVSTLASCFAALAPLCDDGLVRLEDHTTVVIAPEAPQITRLACAAFDAYLAAPRDETAAESVAPRHARAI